MLIKDFSHSPNLPELECPIQMYVRSKLVFVTKFFSKAILLLSNQSIIQVLIKWSTKSQERSNGGGQL